MKKLFSIFSALLVTLALHATLVTHEINLSEISSQGDATWDNATITAAAAWQGVQKWFGDAEYAFDASEYEALVLELEETSSVGVNYVINYADGTANNDVTISAGETSAQLVLKSSKIQKIVIQLTDGGSAKISNLYFKGYAGKVSEEVVTINENDDNGYLGNWDKAVKVWSGSLSGLGLQVDDKLVIKYTLSGSDDQFQIKTISNHAFNFASIVNPESETTSIAFTLNSADITLLNTEGIFINGKNMTITGISVLKHAVLWSGEQVVGNWSGHQEVTADVAVGNILCIRVSAIGTEASPRVSLYCGWNDEDALADGEYYFQGDDEAPMDLEFRVTYKMEQQLRGKNLLVRGVNYTMTDIYVKEGAPVNTVAAYLNVSDAGMATFIVPFNVPALPDGVQAYELTNNGDPTIWATPVDALEADKPVLIVAAQNEDPGYEFISEEGASDDISGKTDLYSNGALVGTYYAIAEVPVSDGSVNNYILSNGSDGVAFYQVLDNSCSVPAYRAYLSCGYNASAAGPNPAPMHIVFRQDATTGIESQELKANTQKLIRNGQILIIRDGRTYNALGTEVK